MRKAEFDRLVAAARYHRPMVTADRLVGLEACLRQLEVQIALFNRPDLATRFGLEPSGTLFVGPAGTGKTHRARYLAGRLERPLYQVSADEFGADAVLLHGFREEDEHVVVEERSGTRVFDRAAFLGTIEVGGQVIVESVRVGSREHDYVVPAVAPAEAASVQMETGGLTDDDWAEAFAGLREAPRMVAVVSRPAASFAGLAREIVRPRGSIRITAPREVYLRANPMRGPRVDEDNLSKLSNALVSAGASDELAKTLGSDLIATAADAWAFQGRGLERAGQLADEGGALAPILDELTAQLETLVADGQRALETLRALDRGNLEATIAPRD